MMDTGRAHICHVCHGKMFEAVVNRTFHRQDPNTKIVTSKSLDITVFKCPDCGEEIYTSDEAKRIENAFENAV